MLRPPHKHPVATTSVLVVCIKVYGAVIACSPRHPSQVTNAWAAAVALESEPNTIPNSLEEGVQFHRSWLSDLPRLLVHVPMLRQHCCQRHERGSSLCDSRITSTLLLEPGHLGIGPETTSETCCNGAPHLVRSSLCCLLRSTSPFWLSPFSA